MTPNCAPEKSWEREYSRREIWATNPGVPDLQLFTITIAKPRLVGEKPIPTIHCGTSL